MSSIQGECFICYDGFTQDNPLTRMPCLCKGSFMIHKKCLEELINNNGSTCKTCQRLLRPYTEVEIQDIIKRIRSGYFDYSDPHNLEYILEADIRITLEYLKEYGAGLKYIKNQTEEICIAAITSYDMDDAVEYVKVFTPRIYLEAVKHSGSNIRFVKKHTPEFWKTPLPDGRVISYIDVCVEAVKRNGMALYDIDEEDQTYEMCLEAVKERGDVIEYVKNPTPLMFVEATRKYGGAIKYIPNFNTRTWHSILLENGEYMTYHRLCMIAVKESAWALEFVEEQTNNICLAAVRKNGEMLKHVKKQKPFVCLEAVRNTKRAIQYIHEFTYELCINIISIDPSYIELIPCVTDDMCIDAVRNNAEVYNYVSKEFKTYRLCKIAIKGLKKNMEIAEGWNEKARLKVQLNRFEGQAEILKNIRT